MTKKSEITEEPVEDFGDPEALMPTPDRLRESEEPEETLQAPVRSPAPEIRALPVEPISGGVSNSPVAIRARKDAHLAKLRR